MIKLSNGVEVSEDAVVSALNKAGINVEPPKPKYIFKAGDVARNENNETRIIVRVNGALKSFSKHGTSISDGQQDFERFDYKYVGRISDFIK